ncbi:hypothetical protein ABG79_02132 [Caloramator mitchellensis]|uniref:ABC-2 family transporter protein n=1 Tax=Caloramator mitchellensis TaxID=908809 RepID=A0A0R3JZU8_CALMK|nr:ABC-2 family transporter protein [Caloramator mitchellensis]KRQ86098.1 hypothetical protein ABG79_02132 [Caloramator mitchellensis]
MRKYIKIFTISIKNNTIYIKDFLIGNLFTLIIITTFYFLWQKIYEQNIKTGFTFQEMLWYLILNQSLHLQYNRIYRTVGQDVKGGEIAYKLNKPYYYPLYVLSDNLGRNLLDFCINSIVALIIGISFVGLIEGYKFYFILPSVLIIILGILLNHLIHITISLSAFWVEENMPFAWIYGKLIFVFGGLLYPISLLPKSLYNFNYYMPWSFVMYHVSKTAIKFNINDFIFTFIGQSIYILIFSFILWFIYIRGVKKLNVNGG